LREHIKKGELRYYSFLSIAWRVVPNLERITILLRGWREGDVEARDDLFAIIHPQLRRIANNMLRHERANHTLEPNALVNELFVRLAGSQPISYVDRIHLFALSAQSMRRILIDYARAAHADRRGGEFRRIGLSSAEGFTPGPQTEHLLALDGLLSKLADADPRAAKVVELRFFGGLQEKEIAEVLGVSEVTIKRDWKAARAWLAGQMHSD
jgi:RNA polymerase sigma factor (TIGR02999 family)